MAQGGSRHEFMLTEATAQREAAAEASESRPGVTRHRLGENELGRLTPSPCPYPPDRGFSFSPFFINLFLESMQVLRLHMGSPRELASIRRYGYLIYTCVTPISTKDT